MDLTDKDFRAARQWIFALIEGLLDPREMDELELLLATRSEIRRYYIRMMHVHAGLHQHASILAPPSARIDDDLFVAFPNLNDAVVAPAILDVEGSSEVEVIASRSISAPMPLSVTPRRRRMTWWWTGGAIAAVIALCIGLWLKPGNLPPQSAPLPIVVKSTQAGSVSASVDAEWDSARQPQRDGDRVVAGQALNLKAGIVEIGLSGGARLLCEGPVRFTVDSPKHVSVQSGSLVARMKGGGLVVQTPVMTITDLGTEFGVRVESDGKTELKVFEGLVRCAGRGLPAPGLLIKAGEEITRTVGGAQVPNAPDSPARQFLRALPQRNPGIDLVDVVEGGDGKGHHRGWGINPATGGYVAADDWPGSPRSGGSFHVFPGGSMLDSCFIIPSDRKPTPVDSRGHQFAFAAGNAVLQAPIWAGGPLPPLGDGQVDTSLAGVNFSAAGHGMLFMHANSAITFNLDAIRARSNADKNLEFLATVGKPHLIGADGTDRATAMTAYILVNGGSRFEKSCAPGQLPFHIDITLDSTAHCLTLAATGASSGPGDGLLVGDPVLKAK